jgi:ribosomal protein S25
MKQIERQQRRKDKEEAKSGGWVEKTIGALHIPDMSSDELVDQLRKTNIKVSMAKRLINELEERRVLSLASRSHNLKVYALEAD